VKFYIEDEKEEVSKVRDPYTLLFKNIVFGTLDKVVVAVYNLMFQGERYI